MIFCIAGKNKIAIDALQYLINIGLTTENLVACITKTDDGVDGWQPSYKAFCKLNSIRIVELKDLYELENLIFFSLEFDRIIKPHLFKTDKLYNIHFSKLPAYKGMYTSVLPILYGENVSGVTLHKIDHGIDTGDILEQIVFDVPRDICSQDLYYLFLNHSIILFKKTFTAVSNNTLPLHKQPIEGASYFSKAALDFKNLPLNFSKTAFEIKNQIRAFAFRAYQLPVFNGHAISHAHITGEKSSRRPGDIIEENELCFTLPSIDYNIILYKDCLDAILENAQMGNLAKLKAYKSNYYDLRAKNKKGWDALIVAAYNEQTEVCKWLVETGCNPNSVNNNGTSVLMYAMTAASKSGKLNTVDYLLQVDASISHKDNKGKSLMEYAHEYGNPVVIAYLQKLKAA